MGRALLALVLGAVAVALPISVISSPDQCVGSDYHVHVWMMGYQGAEWSAHRAFAPVYHTTAHSGVPTPIFYGGALYKIGGLLSSVWGAHVALRLVALFSLAAVYITVRASARAFGAAELFAATAACATIWATYPLTNLYNRSALPEFVAGAMLTCSCCLWVRFLCRPGPSSGWLTALTAALFLCLAASTHPITGMLSGPVLVCIYVLHWFVPIPQRQGALQRHATLLVSGVLVGAVLAPWLCAYRALGPELGISGLLTDLWYPPVPALARVWVQLFPLPFDYNHMTPSAPKVPATVHLDTQVSLPLLVLAVLALGAAYRAPGGSGYRVRLLLAAAGPALLGLVLFAISVSPAVWDALPAGLHPWVAKVQFAFRLVGPINTLVLVLVLLGLTFRNAIAPVAQAPWTGPPVVLAVVLTLAACGLVQKAMNGRAACSPHHLPTKRTDPNYTLWLRSVASHAAGDYATPDDVLPLAPTERMNLTMCPVSLGTGGEFGRVHPVQVTLASGVYVGTRFVPFRWSEIRVDGTPVPWEQLRQWNDPQPTPVPLPVRLAVPVPAGTHTIEYAFAPPRVWSALNTIADRILLGWIALVLVWSVAGVIRERLAGEGQPGSPRAPASGAYGAA
jgi:hypothetical protein